MLIAANRPHVQDVPIDTSKPRHPVTAEMTALTDAKTKKIAPGYQTEDFEGKPVTIAPPDGRRPQFVYFVLDGCPCSFDAEPLFHRLHKRYKGKIDFVSVTDAGREKARDWSVQMLVPYAVVPNPEKNIMRAYEAKSSVYAALVTKDGRIEKMWPGYSQGILKEQNAMMAKLVGERAEPFDASVAPIEKTTSCNF